MGGTQQAVRTEQGTAFSQGGAECVWPSRRTPAGSAFQQAASEQAVLRPKPEQGLTDSRHQKRGGSRCQSPDLEHRGKGRSSESNWAEESYLSTDDDIAGTDAVTLSGI